MPEASEGEKAIQAAREVLAHCLRPSDSIHQDLKNRLDEMRKQPTHTGVKTVVAYIDEVAARSDALHAQAVKDLGRFVAAVNEGVPARLSEAAADSQSKLR